MEGVSGAFCIMTMVKSISGCLTKYWRWRGYKVEVGIMFWCLSNIFAGIGDWLREMIDKRNAFKFPGYNLVQMISI